MNALYAFELPSERALKLGSGFDGCERGKEGGGSSGGRNMDRNRVVGGQA